jgi:hypothetical protein
MRPWWQKHKGNNLISKKRTRDFLLSLTNNKKLFFFFFSFLELIRNIHGDARTIAEIPYRLYFTRLL